jgi:hypothetical protein
MSVGSGSDANPRDGDRITVDVDVRGDCVCVTRIDIHGCNALGLVARELSEMAQGRSPQVVARIAPREIIERLGLTAEDERCALTAIGALRAAIVDAHVKAL